MGLPWWFWMVLGLWSGPGICYSVALLVMKPIGGLDENGEPYKPVPRLKKVLLFPLGLVVLVVLWPLALWAEIDESHLLKKVMMFCVQFVVVVVTWPLLLWRAVRESWR